MRIEQQPPRPDLMLICKSFEPWIDAYQAKDLLVYGGTGFIGKWLVNSLIEINKQFQSQINIQLITRDSAKAKSMFREVDVRSIKFIQHDFNNPLEGSNIHADIIFQGATTSNKVFQEKNPKSTLSVSLNATSHACNVKSKNDSKPMIIHLSSGAIYEQPKFNQALQSETSTALNYNGSSYAKAKIKSEELLQASFTEGKIDYQSPRLFAFYGPLLPIDEHFAIGNFLRDGVSDFPIKLTGNPLTTRSYMHPIDLISILLRLATYRNFSPVNIGSDIPITMIDLALLISSLTNKKAPQVLNPNAEISNYVPEIKYIKTVLKYSHQISLEQGISQWISWLDVDY
jgi:nucleoside-diphosphate-sugar epimerase